MLTRPAKAIFRNAVTGWRPRALAAATLLALAPAAQAAPDAGLAAAAQICGAPSPSFAAPEPADVLAELATRLAGHGWRPVSHNDLAEDRLQQIKTASAFDLMPRMVLQLLDGRLSAHHLRTIKGRGLFTLPEPTAYLLVNADSGALMFASTFRHRDNPGIDLRCTVLARADGYLDSFKPQSTLGVLRTKLGGGDGFATMSVLNRAHPQKGLGHRRGEVQVALIDADAITQETAAPFPFSVRLDIRSYAKPPLTQ